MIRLSVGLVKSRTRLRVQKSRNVPAPSSLVESQFSISSSTLRSPYKKKGQSAMQHDSSTTSTATREMQLPAASASSASPPLQRPPQTPQRLQERGPNDTVVLHSPYGPTRNATYGWGSLFSAPLPAVVPGHPNIHIGISSLNAVPTIGKSDRSMRSLIAQYRKKFTSLEHCYPYHRIGDAAAWQSWADMVRDSNAVKTTATPEASATVPLVNASRFIYTVKANNVLTHTKQLQMQDTEVLDVVQTFFHQRCPLLEPFLGPVLVQLPPSFSFSAANLQRLADLHDHLTKEEREMREVVLPSNSSDEPTSFSRRCRRIRVAVEFRHRSWYRQETFDLLRSFHWALVVAHHHDDATFSNVVDTGAGFLYLRLHGALGKHTGDYGPLAMKLWAEELVSYLYPSGATAAESETYPREVFVYLNNSDSNVGGTTSSTVDATCLAEHLRHLLQQRVSCSAQQPMSSERAATPPSTPQTATGKERANEEVQRPPPLAAVVSAETVGAATASPSDDDTDDDDVAPSAKRPRTSTSSGASRDDEVVID